MQQGRSHPLFHLRPCGAINPRWSLCNPPEASVFETRSGLSHDPGVLEQMFASTVNASAEH
jgi:hypothetical protein